MVTDDATVVHLFNAIQQAQSATAASLEDAKKLRGTGKPTLPAPGAHEIGQKKPGKKAKQLEAAKTKDRKPCTFCTSTPHTKVRI